MLATRESSVVGVVKEAAENQADSTAVPGVDIAAAPAGKQPIEIAGSEKKPDQHYYSGEELEEKQVQRASRLNELLSYYATGRSTAAQQVQESHEGQPNLATDITEMLLTFQDERIIAQDDLRQHLHIYNQTLHYEVAEFLTETATSRSVTREALTHKLKQDTQQRKVEVQTYLNELRRLRVARQVGEQVPSTKEVEEIKTVNSLEHAPRSEPAPLNTPTIVETPSPPDRGPLEIEELVLFLMTLTGPITLDKLEKYFDRDRLDTYWDEFISLLAEFKPDNWNELEKSRPKTGIERKN